jgi:hypothetical protein
VNVERRTSLSNYVILRRRAVSRPEGASAKESVWGRWYVPWLTAALVLAGLIVAAVVALEIVTATHRPASVPTPPSTPVTPPHVEGLVSES